MLDDALFLPERYEVLSAQTAVAQNQRLDHASSAVIALHLATRRINCHDWIHIIRRQRFLLLRRHPGKLEEQMQIVIVKIGCPTTMIWSLQLQKQFQRHLLLLY